VVHGRVEAVFNGNIIRHQIRQTLGATNAPLCPVFVGGINGNRWARGCMRLEFRQVPVGMRPPAANQSFQSVFRSGGSFVRWDRWRVPLKLSLAVNPDFNISAAR